VFVWVEFPNDPDVKELPDSSQRDSISSNPMVRAGGSGRAQKGGMSAEEDEELDMYGSAVYWCEPNEAHMRPRNPSQAVFFSQLEDIYIGKKTEAFVFEHVDASLCLSLYTPTVVLDLQMETQGFRNLWIKSIMALLQLNRIIGARKDADADNALITVPQHLTRDRKASQPGLTPVRNEHTPAHQRRCPYTDDLFSLTSCALLCVSAFSVCQVWLHRRTMSRDSLYGSFSFPSSDSAAAHPRSPSWQPMTPLMLPSPMARKSSGTDGDQLLTPPVRKTSDLDLGRPMFNFTPSGRKASDVAGDAAAAVIVEGDEKDEAEEKA
jgi:hypothetical protein